jgi:hypothetical protein
MAALLLAMRSLQRVCPLKRGIEIVQWMHMMAYLRAVVAKGVGLWQDANQAGVRRVAREQTAADVVAALVGGEAEADAIRSAGDVVLR